MELNGYFTKAGLELSAKLLTGTPLEITRAEAGSGQLSDPLNAAALPEPMQAMRIGPLSRSDSTATLATSLLAAEAEQEYALTMLGVYARDPDLGEILWKVYLLTEPIQITVGDPLVLRFHLEETLSPQIPVEVACQLNGLATQEDLDPLRRQIELYVKPFTQSTVPDVTVSIPADQLSAYFSGLPRLLTENLTVNVTGIFTGTLSVCNFYGPGSLKIIGDPQNSFECRGQMEVRNCKLKVWLSYLDFNSTASGAGDSLTLDNDLSVEVGYCSFQGNRSNVGVNTSKCPAVALVNCSMSGYQSVVLANVCSMISIRNNDTSRYKNNRVGIYAWAGAVVFLAESAPHTLGASANKNNGGLIVDYSGNTL